MFEGFERWYSNFNICDFYKSSLSLLPVAAVFAYCMKFHLAKLLQKCMQFSQMEFLTIFRNQRFLSVNIMSRGETDKQTKNKPISCKRWGKGPTQFLLYFFFIRFFFSDFYFLNRLKIWKLFFIFISKLKINKKS